MGSQMVKIVRRGGRSPTSAATGATKSFVAMSGYVMAIGIYSVLLTHSLGMHTGSFTVTRPSIGAWVSYGLGTENQNLPSFIVIAPHSPYAGGQVWGSDFLPGAHQGTRVVPGSNPVPNITPRVSGKLQELELAVQVGVQPWG